MLGEDHPALGKSKKLVNKRLKSIQKSFEAGLIDLYLKDLEWSEFPIGCISEEEGELKVTQGMIHYKKQLVKIKTKDEINFNERIVTIVDELKSIGYSDKLSYTVTGRLLHLSFPDYIKDPDPDIFKSRYKHNKSK